MKKFSAGLTLRISFTFSCFAALLLLGVGILSYSSGLRALESAAISELLSTAMGKASHIDEWIHNMVNDVETKAVAPD